MQSNQAQDNPTNSLSARDRLKLLERVFKDGVSVSDACSAFSVSRNTFYKWARRNGQRIKSDQDELASLQNRNPRRRRASPQRISVEVEQAIRKIVALHPEWGKHRILSELHRRSIAVGIHGVGNALTRLQLNTPQLRQRYHEALASNTPLGKLLTAQDRARLVERVLRGRIPLSIVSRDSGVSRLTLYKWLGRYNRALRDDKDVLEALEDRKRQVERWGNQATEEQERQVLEIVRTEPAWGKYRLSQKLREQYGYISLGIHGVSNVLKRNDLATAQRRKTWAAIQIEPAVRPQAGWEERPKQILEEFVPGLAPAPPPPGLRPSGPAALFFRQLRRSSPFFLLSLVLLFGLYGWGYLLGSAQTPNQATGFAFASAALLMGSIFFLYSLKYYFTLAVVLSFSREAGEGEVHSAKFKVQSLVPQSGWLARLFGIDRAAQSALPPVQAGMRSSGLEPDISQVTLERRPFISVHLPMYNEKRVAERLLTACMSFDYPNFEVIVADDSTDETTEIVRRFAEAHNRSIGHRAKGIGKQNSTLSALGSTPFIKVIHRDSREGFKGGALREALRVSDPRAEFVVVFDADFVPYPDTLELFLKYFQVNAGSLDFVKQNHELRRMNYGNTNHDSSFPSTVRYGAGMIHDSCRIAAIQGYQWHVLNKSENWITRGVRSEYAGSYVIERSGAELYGGLKQIAGSVYMIRRDLLDRFGWGTSITEDFQLTLRLYESGYKVVYTPYIQAPAECASTLKRLIRQRMRWAEGHSFNIRKQFFRLLFGRCADVGSAKFKVQSAKLQFKDQSSREQKQWLPSPLSLSEKLEFLYLSPYYLQAAFFLLGTISWLFSETIFKARLPFWTEVWGWSLVFTNLIALPLMNAVGLFLEEAEERDYLGILAFIVLTYFLTPFQAYAAVKGFTEREEGPWFRTPKTGRITDFFTRGRFYRFIAGILPRLHPDVRRGATGGQAGRAAVVHSQIPNSKFQILNYLTNHQLPTTSHYLSLDTANNQFNNFSIRPRRVRWVSKIVFSLLLVFTVTAYSFSKGVPEVLATNPSSCNGTNCTFYLHDSASTTLTGTITEWKLDVGADTTDSTTTVISVNNKLSAPLWFQYKPGTTNSSEESAQSCSSNTPDNAGWFFDTAFGPTTPGSIAAGTWTFYYNEIDNRDGNVGNMTVCVWDVTVSGGVIDTSSLLFEASHSTLDHWDTAVNDTSFTFSGSNYSLSANHYLYVEYFSSLTTISSAGPSTNFTSTLRTGPTYSDPRIVTPQITIPENSIIFIALAPFIPYMVMWIRRRRLVYV